MPSPEKALLTRAQRALAQARTVEEFRDARDLCVDALGHARRKKFARDVLLGLACLAIQAEHGLGTALSKMKLAKGRPKRSTGGAGSGDPRTTGEPRTTPKFLKELGLTKQKSHRAQLLATIPKQALDRWLAERSAEGKEPTLAAARQYLLELLRKSLRVNRTPADSEAPVNALGEILEHDRMLTQLLSRIRDGGIVEFKPVEARFISRVLKEIEELARQDAK